MEALNSATGSWELLPTEALTTIFAFLPIGDRCSASATCTKWRELFFLPIFWRRLTLILSTRKDGVKSEFLSKIAHCIKYLEIVWPHPWLVDQQNKKQRDSVRSVDKDIANNLTIFFQALGQNTCLKSLVLKFENAESVDDHFCAVVTDSVRQILTTCKRLEFISLGHHSKITWKKISTKARQEILLENVQELHISCLEINDSLKSNKREQIPEMCEHAFLHFKQLNKIRVLGINWSDITPNLINSLCNRNSGASRMQKLVIYLQNHGNCRENCHPCEEQWQKFTSLNPELKICFVILNALTTICPAVRNIAGNVHMLKFMECGEINEAPLSNLMNWFQDTLEAHIYISMKKAIDLPNGECLYEHACVCKNLKYLSILGYYIEDNDLLALAQSFPKLEHLIVTKAHILTFALATMYMVPISGTKYTQFQAQMSEYMKKPWKALTSLPFHQLYYTEGKDDEFYLTGKSNITEGPNSNSTDGQGLDACFWLKIRRVNLTIYFYKQRFICLPSSFHEWFVI